MSKENACTWIRLGSWEVAPAQIGPIGIGEAVAMAEALGCELPTIELVNEIWRAADLRIFPTQRSVENGLLSDWGPSMFSPATLADQERRIEREIGGRPYKLLAGAFKDVVRDERGRIGLYGWHRPDGTVRQDFFPGHGLWWKDYSQGLRLARRVA